MFGQTFYHKTLRKNVILFGTLFNDVYLNRQDSEGNQYDTVKVPISYGPKEKTLARVNQDPNLDKPFQIVLPRMAFELTGMQYDNQRKLPTIGKSHVKQDLEASRTDRLKYLYNPVPYNLNFSLYIMVRNAEDGTRIVEQILPYFAPEWTMTVNLISEMETVLDIPTIIQTVTVSDNYEGGVEERRTIIWQLDFIMKTYLFGPVKRQGVIKTADINFFDDTVAIDPLSSINIEPGLQSNGAPTSNASQSLPVDSILADDNYGYIITKTDL